MSCQGIQGQKANDFLPQPSNFSTALVLQALGEEKVTKPNIIYKDHKVRSERTVRKPLESMRKMSNGIGGDVVSRKKWHTPFLVQH